MVTWLLMCLEHGESYNGIWLRLAHPGKDLQELIRCHFLLSCNCQHMILSFMAKQPCGWSSWGEPACGRDVYMVFEIFDSLARVETSTQVCSLQLHTLAPSQPTVLPSPAPLPPHPSSFCSIVLYCSSQVISWLGWKHIEIGPRSFPTLHLVKPLSYKISKTIMIRWGDNPVI